MAITTSVLTGGSNSHTTTSEEVNAVATDFASEGIIGTLVNTNGVAPATGGFAVNAQGSPDATVAVSAGTAYVTGTPTSQTSQTFRVKNSASANVTISANASGSTKYDWIYIKLDPTTMNTPNTAGDDVATLVASRSSSATADDGTPPTYGLVLAVVTVANGFTTITNGNIADSRIQSGMQSSPTTASSASWTTVGYTPSTVTALGNRSYTCLFSNVDLTGSLSPGMRLRTTRTVAAPTQCADLEASSSHYFSKTSPSGLSFTDEFTCMAWVKLESYTAGGIIARRNADTEGWSLEVAATGQVNLGGYRIASNNAQNVSYQSLPLNKWVHVAATLDMSAGTGTIYFDGVLVPSAVSVTGTATALVQGTTALVVGAAKSAGTNPFDGKIVQAAVFSDDLAAATIRSYMSQGLSGSETSLVSAFSLNNTLNDLNANANNLSAQNSAVATDTDSPFGTQSTGTISSTLDYAIITKTAFSTHTTLTVQVPEGCTIPTSGGVSAVAYSTQDTPYLFPKQRDKWQVGLIHLTDDTQSSPSSGTWYNLGSCYFTIPVGVWVPGYQVTLDIAGGASGTSQQSTLSTANNTESDTQLTARIYIPSNTEIMGPVTRQKLGGINLAAATIYYLNSKQDTGGSVSSIKFKGSDSGATVVTAELSYL